MNRSPCWYMPLLPILPVILLEEAAWLERYDYEPPVTVQPAETYQAEHCTGDLLLLHVHRANEPVE